MDREYKSFKYLGGEFIGSGLLEVGKIYKVSESSIEKQWFLWISKFSALMLFETDLKYFEVIK